MKPSPQRSPMNKPQYCKCDPTFPMPFSPSENCYYCYNTECEMYGKQQRLQNEPQLSAETSCTWNGAIMKDWEKRFDAFFPVNETLSEFDPGGWLFWKETQPEIKHFLATALDEQKEEFESRVKKAIKHGTLPIPNPYGTTVKVERHNQVVAEMEQILLNRKAETNSVPNSEQRCRR